jgi:hypothetical protein
MVELLCPRICCQRSQGSRIELLIYIHNEVLKYSVSHNASHSGLKQETDCPKRRNRVKTLGRLGLLTLTVVILPMAGVSRSWAGGDDIVVSKMADISLPLPSRVTSNGKQYDIVRNMLSNNGYIYHAGFDQKGI